MFTESLKGPVLRLEHRGLQLSVLFLALFWFENYKYKAGMFLLVWLLSGGYNRCYVISRTFKRDLRFLNRVLRMLYSLVKAMALRSTVMDVFRNVMERHPQDIMFINVQTDEKWTFQMMEEESNRIANVFLDQGYKKGDCIALYMMNRPEYVACWLGLAKIGVITALVNTNVKEDSLVKVLEVADAQALIYGLELKDCVENVREKLQEKKFQLYFSRKGTEESQTGNGRDKDLDFILSEASLINDKFKKCKISHTDILFYIYTSGTTGLPKPVKIRHIRQVLVFEGTRNMLNLNKNDIIYSYLPLYHASGGQIGIGNAFSSGSTVVIKKKFSASSFWKDCVKYNVSGTQYIGEICRFLLATKSCPEERQHSLKVMFGNGLRPEIWVPFVERFKIPYIAEFYGSTEGNCTIVNFDNTVGAVGCIPNLLPRFITRNLVPLCIIQVNPFTLEHNRDGKGFCIECERGEMGEGVGEIVKGIPTKEFEGYTNEEENNKKILKNVFKTGDRYFRSGDLLYIDEFGYIYFKDRLGDTYRWKGENVSSFEVETTASSVLKNEVDGAVYGVMVPGNEGRAGMMALPSSENNSEVLQKLFEGLMSKLPSYAIPLFIRFLKGGLTLTGTFKMKKFDLKREGFNVNIIKDDEIYYMRKHGYEKLTNEMYEAICSGLIQF